VTVRRKSSEKKCLTTTAVVPTMKQVWWLPFVLFAGCALAQPASNLSQLTVPATKTSVLSGRLVVSIPATAVSRAMQHGIMSAPEADQEQTRIVIDAGDQRMVLMVYELFERAGAEFDAEVKTQAGRLPVKVAVQNWPLSSSLRAAAYFPEAPTQDREANLVMGVFVAQPDGSVQNLMWYANPAGAKPSAGAMLLAKSMAKTIGPGARALTLSAGERELSGYSQTQSVFIRVPEGYVVTAQQGPDFIVHHIHKMTAFGSPRASIGIYLGDYPQNREGEKSETSLLFGKQVTWYQKTVNVGDATTITASAVVSLHGVDPDSTRPATYAPSYADVFLSAADATTLQELKSVAATLRIATANHIKK
jgi:hypothetical protein